MLSLQVWKQPGQRCPAQHGIVAGMSTNSTERNTSSTQLASSRWKSFPVHICAPANPTWVFAECLNLKAEGLARATQRRIGDTKQLQTDNAAEIINTTGPTRAALLPLGHAKCRAWSTGLCCHIATLHKSRTAGRHSINACPAACVVCRWVKTCRSNAAGK